MTARSAKKGPQLGLAGLGMELAAAVIGGTLLGLWIDRSYGSAPWAAVIGGLVGIVGGLYNFVRQANRAMKADEKEREGGAR